MFVGNDPSATTNTAQANVSLGLTALDEITSGDRNTAVGHNALTKAKAGVNNVAMGYNTLNNVTSGNYNVGIGNLISKKHIRKRTKEDLFNFVAERFKGREITDITAFPIGTEGIDYTSKNNVLLVGDAAGLAETLLGEGIYNAVISGKYAAQSIIDSRENSKSATTLYNSFLKKLSDELALYNKGAKILYGFPKISYFAMKLWLGEKFMTGYSNGQTLSQIMGKKKSVIS